MDNRVICNCTFSVFRYIRVGFMNIYLVKKRRINVSSFFWFPFYFDTHISCTRFIFGFLFEKQQENGTNTTIYIHNQTEKKENLLLFWNVKKRERLENKTNIAIAHSFRTESSQWIALTELFKQASLWFIHIDLCVCVCDEDNFATKLLIKTNRQSLWKCGASFTGVYRYCWMHFSLAPNIYTHIGTNSYINRTIWTIYIFRKRMKERNPAQILMEQTKHEA